MLRSDLLPGRGHTVAGEGMLIGKVEGALASDP
jgi:hypothetical protein